MLLRECETEKTKRTCYKNDKKNRTKKFVCNEYLREEREIHSKKQTRTIFSHVYDRLDIAANQNEPEFAHQTQTACTRRDTKNSDP